MGEKRKKLSDVLPWSVVVFNIVAIDGMYLDVTRAQREGVTTPLEYWTRTRAEIRAAAGIPPIFIRDPKERRRWTQKLAFGKTQDELLEEEEKRYLKYRFLAPLRCRWVFLRQNRGYVNVWAFMHTWMTDERLKNSGMNNLAANDFARRPTLPDKIDEVFFRVQNAMAFPAVAMPTLTGNSALEHFFYHDGRKPSGQLMKCAPIGYKRYPLGYTLLKNHRRPFDERFIYKEFDFCS